MDPMPRRGYERAARRAGSQSASSWPVTGSVMEADVAGAEDTDELARLLALKFRLAEEGGMVGVAPPPAPPAVDPLLLPLLPLPIGGLTAMAGLTAAELSVAGPAPGVDAPPDEERQRAVVLPPPLPPPAPLPAAPGLVMVPVGEISPLGVGDVTPIS